MLYPFDHPHMGSHAEVTARLGGKGASLWAMVHKLHLPVPPGFTLSTDECQRFLGEGLSPPLKDAIRQAISNVGQQVGRHFGDPANPLLVSVRSGAAASMPGMMDTVLNVGLTAQTTEGLAQLAGDRAFAQDSYRRFLRAYAEVVLDLDLSHVSDGDGAGAACDEEIEALRRQIATHIGLDVLDDPWQLLFSAVEAVFKSWNSPRAQHYREREGIAHDLGTAVNIQAMVFGNLDEQSGTGVVFTRDPSSGEAVPRGDFLAHAQGDDVVAGTHRTQPLDALERALPQAYAELTRSMGVLELYYRDLCDIEFTVERGRLWVLQARAGKRSPAAAARIAVELAQDPRFGLSRADAIARVPAELLDGTRSVQQASGTGTPIATGLGASPGVASGRIVFDPDRALEWSERGEDVILVRRETSPQDVHGMGVARGILTTLGGLMSHAAVVARAWGIPAVVGAKGITLADESMTIGQTVCREGDLLSIDGERGQVFLGAIDREAKPDPYLQILRSWMSDHDVLLAPRPEAPKSPSRNSYNKETS